VQKAYVHFLDEKRDGRVEIPTDPAELEEAMRTIGRAIKGVTGRDFDRNPSDRKACRECDWKRLCPSST